MRSVLLWSLLFLPATGCRSPYYADRGAAVGAITGAVAGAALGEDSGDAASGAVVGSAVGALTGAAVGNAIDQDMAHARARVERRLGRSMSGAVTLHDVIEMTQAGLSEQVIQTHIQSNGAAQPPGVQDLIALRNAGVSDSVIQALQQAPPPQVSPAASTHRGPPVILEEYHYVAPPIPPYGPYGPYRYHRHWRHPRRSGVSWGVTIGN